MATRFAILAVALAVALAAGCSHDTCVRNSDCPAGDMCSAVGMCVTAVVDEAPPGDGGLDAATPDAAIDGGS